MSNMLIISMYERLYHSSIAALAHKLGGISSNYNTQESCLVVLNKIINKLFSNHLLDFDDLEILKGLIESKTRDNTLIALYILNSKCDEYRKLNNLDSMDYYNPILWKLW